MPPIPFVRFFEVHDSDDLGHILFADLWPLKSGLLCFTESSSFFGWRYRFRAINLVLVRHNLPSLSMR